jgi:hypothetical protein
VTAYGRAESWRLEFDNLHELADAGMTVETFKPGDRITVLGSRARDKSRSAYVRRLERQSDGLLYEQIGSSPRVRSRRR